MDNILLQLSIIQITVFIFFAVLEKTYPTRKFPTTALFNFLWCCIGVFALMWLRVLLSIWDFSVLSAFSLEFIDSYIAQGFIFYLFYSFGNYWFHRIKHSNSWLWIYLHRLHHAPAHMQTKIAFFRHPFEILANSIYLLVLGKIIIGVSFEVIAIALTIEGCLECFHHSNIKIPSKLRWIGYIIQLPEMHLVHHQQQLHRYNYSPFLWDTVFKTVRIPINWNMQLGFKQSANLRKYLYCK